MALTVDYSVTPFLITVPKSDLDLITGTQYQLTVDAYWLLLSDYTDNENTMAQPKLYSRIPATSSTPSITEIDGTYYALQFEDGAYSVNIIDGNTNIREVEVKNSVSVNTNNTTGFINPVFLQASTFGDVVAIDTLNGKAGTAFPIGTKGTPSSNTTDAIAIASAQNINKLYIIGDTTLDTGDDVSGFIIFGQSAISTTITVNAGANTLNTEFRDATVTGILDGGSILRECLIGTLSYVSGFLDRCGLGAFPVTLDGVSQAMLIDCFSTVAGGGTPSVDMGGFGSSLAIRGYSGGLTISNKTGVDPVSIDMESGHIVFDATVTDTSNIFVRGMARMTDKSTGADKIDSVGLLSGSGTVRGSHHVAIKSTGTAGTLAPLGTMDFPVNNIADALIIAKQNSVMTLHIMDTITTAGTEDLSMYTVRGTSPAVSNLIVTAGTTTTNSTFRELNLSGALSSTGSIIERCQIGNLTGVQNYMYQCFLYGTVGLSGDTTSAFCSIAPIAPSQKAYFDFGGLANTIIISDWGAGIATFKNMVTGSFAGISGTGGRIELDVSNTGGKLVHGGSLNLNAVNLDSVDTILDHSVSNSVWDKVIV